MQPLGLLWWFSDGTLRFHCKGTSLIPGQRTNITQAMWHSQKKKERKSTKCTALSAGFLGGHIVSWL